MTHKKVLLVALVLMLMSGWLRYQLYVLEHAPHAFEHEAAR